MTRGTVAFESLIQWFLPGVILAPTPEDNWQGLETFFIFITGRFY